MVGVVILSSMNSSLLRFCHVVAVSSFLASPVFAGDLSRWEAGKARVVGDKVLLPDDLGGYDFVCPDASAVTIGEKPTVVGDSKSIVFSGAQTEVFKTVRPYPPFPGTFSVSLLVCPAEMSGEADGTILRYGLQWELRYLVKESKLSLVVWHQSNVYTTVNLPLKPGVWHEVKATVEPASIRLESGKDVVSKVLTEGGVFEEPKPVNMVLGGTPNATDGVRSVSRPFFGAVADIRINVE